MRFRDIIVRHEVLIFLVLVVLAVTVGAINPVFFSIFNVFSLLKNSTVIGLFAIGFFLVLVTGGLDVSFAAVGATAMYCTVNFAVAFFPGAPFVVLCAVSALIGVFLGLINGLLVTKLRRRRSSSRLGRSASSAAFCCSLSGRTWCGSCRSR